MSSPEENVALAREGLEAFERLDAEGALRFLDPEVEIYTADELINAGTHHGHEGFMQWVANWMDAWESFENNPVRLEPVGEHHVVAQIHQRGVGKGSGAEVETEVGYMFEQRGGRAVAVHLYGSFARALEVAREREGVGE